MSTLENNENNIHSRVNSEFPMNKSIKCMNQSL